MDFKLENVGLGAVSEKFDDELLKVIDNVLDMNTEAKTQREVNIKIKIKPNPEDREMCEMEAIVSSKLAPTKTLISVLRVGVSEHGEVNAVEYTPKQGSLFEEQEKPKNNLHQINN